MRKLLLLTLLVSNLQLFAIEINQKFGKISKEELLMNVYEKDSSAEAVILFDIGKTYFNYNQDKGFQMKFERHIRIKILNEEGFSYGNFSISLYHENENREKVVGIKAITYNLEGNKIIKTKLKNRDIYNIEDSKNTTIEKFSLPSIKNGSVIEVSYSIVSDYFYNLQKWKFQHYIPCMWSEYTVEIPEYFRYNKIAKGYLPFAINETEYYTDYINITNKSRTGGNSISNSTVRTNYNTQRYDYKKQVIKLAVEDAPAMETEAFMLSASNYLSSIEFELSQIQFPNSKLHRYSESWESINNKLLEHPEFGNQLKNGKFLSDIVEEIKTKSNNPKVQIAMLYNFITNNYKWNGKNSIYTSKNLKKTYNEKTGNSADINLLTVLLLREAGFEAEPVIISTRNHGLLNVVHPSISQMNYIIALLRLDGKSILLDATDPYCELGMLPPRCINDKGRVISNKNSSWVNIEPTNKYSTTLFANINISKDNMEGSLTIKDDGIAAYYFRSKYNSFNSEEEYITDLESENPGIKINESTFENIDSIYKPIKYEFSNLKIDSYDNLGNLIYFNPVIFDKTEENPFKLEERNFPIDYNYNYNQKYIFNYTLPDGYIVEEMPSNEQIMLPENAATYRYIIKQTGNMIQLTIQFDINKRQFLPNEYSILKEMYNRIIAKENEQVVLKKI